MKRLLMTVLCCILSLSLHGRACAADNDTDPKDSSLVANVKRIALDISSIGVKNSDQYKDSNITGLRANSQTTVKGLLDFSLEYDNPSIRWLNNAYVAYGRTEIRPKNKKKTVNITEDVIRPSTELDFKLYKLGEYDVGPYVYGEYETEFEKYEDTPHYHLLRAATGIIIFKKDESSGAHLGLLGEYDLSYSNRHTKKYALEARTEWEIPLRDGVDFDVEGYYRYYFHFNEYTGSDLKYDLYASGRMKVKLIGNFRLSPYVTYRYVKSREADDPGSTLVTGLSLSYTGKFNFW